jgi:uncharacterized membrane protein YsdA (DUF1294 family)
LPFAQQINAPGKPVIIALTPQKPYENERENYLLERQKRLWFYHARFWEKQIFVQIKEFENRRFRPEMGKALTYELSTGRDGRLCAKNAKLTEKPPKEFSKSILLAITFLAIICISLFLNILSMATILTYVILSIVTYLTYAKDKSAAEDGSWRTPENTLHILALLGGWPGAIIAQKKLRHKSRKQPFRFIFWVTALVNTASLFWFTTPTGINWLNNTIANILMLLSSLRKIGYKLSCQIYNLTFQ